MSGRVYPTMYDSMADPILCPIDFSACSAHALQYAIVLAGKVGTTIKVMHVVERPDPLLRKQEYLEYLTEHYRSQLAAVMARVRTQHPDRVEELAITVIGQPHVAIVEYAATHPCYMIVLGTHGRTGISRVLLGSVAERVVRTSPVPVLTVPLPT